MKAKELAALLQINPDMDVCIKEDIVINCYGDTEPCYQEIKSIGIEKGKVLISSKGRNIPLIVEMKNPELFMMELCSRISNK